VVTTYLHLKEIGNAEVMVFLWGSLLLEA